MQNTANTQSDENIVEAWLKEPDEKPIPKRVPSTAHQRGQMTTELGSLREKILLRKIMREGPTQ